MNIYFLLLQGGQTSLTIEAWDMGEARRIAYKKILDGWDIYAVRGAYSDYESRLI